MRKTLCALLVLVAAVAFTPQPIRASGDPNFATYYIGADGNGAPRLGADGLAYANNPNYGRLTMLFAHTYTGDAYPTKTINHYHPLGAVRYTGPSTNPSTTFANARTPEGARAPLTLQPGNGAFAGKYVSNQGSPTSSDYAALSIRSIESLRQGAGPQGSAPTTPFSYSNLDPASATYDASWQAYLNTASSEWLLLNSSPMIPTEFTHDGGTFAGSVAQVDVGLKLVEMSPGLQVFNSSGSPLFTGGSGSIEGLGVLDADFEFTPVFGTSLGPAATPALYDAKFTLVDLRTGGAFLGESGQFSYSFQVVPEPTASVLGGLALIGLLGYRRRDVRTPPMGSAPIQVV